MDQKDYIVKLLFGDVADILDSRQRQDLEIWAASDPENQAVMNDFRDKGWLMRQIQLRQRLEKNFDPGQVLQAIAAEVQRLTGEVRATSEPRAILRGLFGTRRWVAILIPLVLGLGLLLLALRLFLPGGKPNPETARSYFTPATPHAQLSYAGTTYTSDMIATRGGLEEGPMGITSDGNDLYFSGQGVDTALSGYYDVSTLASNTIGLQLPDSSFINMNAKASVSIPSFFSARHRKIKMQGQGLFRIRSSRKGWQPFIVDVRPPDILKKWFPGDSGLLVVASNGKDSFDIQANPDDSSIIVSLFSGTLKIIQPDSTLLLHSGDAYLLDKSGKATVLTTDDLPGAGAWRKNEFLFNMQPAEDILRELSRWYDAKIRFEKRPSGVYRIWGRRDEPIDSLLSRMKRAPYHFEYSVRKDTIIVSH